MPVTKFRPIIPDEIPYPLKHREKILVTGGTGFLGKRLVELLVREGYPVRVLARKLSNINRLKELGVEIYCGDVADMVSFEQAFEGIDFVVHAAAGTSGSKEDCESGTIQGTGNVLELCREKEISKLIYISSCSVYGVADYKTGRLVNEESSLERFPEKRGDYSASKQKAEALVAEAIENNRVTAVILRPGTILGPGGDIYTPMMGFSLMNRVFIVIGDGKFELPFVYIDNLVDAVIRSIQSNEANNRVFNVVDSETIDKRQYMEKLIKEVISEISGTIYPLQFIVLCNPGAGSFMPYFKKRAVSDNLSTGFFTAEYQV